MIKYTSEFLEFWENYSKTAKKWWLLGPAGWDPEIRKNDTGQMFRDTTYPPASVLIDDFDTSHVPVRVYHPRGVDSPARFILYVHGGGYAFGDRESEMSIATRMAFVTDSVVCTLSYGLAPEKKHPAALEGCMTVLRWIFDTACAKYGVRNKRVVIVGTSSGATLTASLSMLQEFEGKVQAQILIAPILDNTVEGRESWNQEVIDLPPAKLRCYQDMKFVGQDRKDFRCSPAYADKETLQSSPPTLMLIPENCIAKDSSMAFAETLRTHGLTVRTKLIENAPHVMLMEKLLGIDLVSFMVAFMDEIEQGSFGITAVQKSQEGGQAVEA